MTTAIAETKRELIEHEPILTPAEVVENATTQAKLLMDIVDRTKCYQAIHGKKHLQVEAWETIGAFNRAYAQTKEVRPITKDGEVIGYEAHVQLWRDGTVIGSAIMPCYLTENCCRGKQGDDKHRACMSAAQTFAEGKAFRMNFAYVAILAGYEPVPAEEMGDDDGGKPSAPSTQLTSKYGDLKAAIDMAWLRESIESLEWAAGPYLKEKYPNARGDTIKALVESLTTSERQEFVAEVQKRLDALRK